jgi:5-methyltetrahydrofolate--homocysteine methyltransferase
VDVQAEKFVEKAKQSIPKIVAMSALLTTTAPEQKTVIESLEKAGIRKNVSIAVGGAAVSGEWAREIGAEIYSDNAISAVEACKTITDKN